MLCDTRGEELKKHKGLMAYPSPITILAPKNIHSDSACRKFLYGSESKKHKGLELQYSACTQNTMLAIKKGAVS